jgi:hypothetical protein
MLEVAILPLAGAAADRPVRFTLTQISGNSFFPDFST